MRSVLVALLALLPATALADRIYNGDKSVTHDCAKDPEVVVNASGGTYTFTGACTKLVFTGSDGKVKAESVAKLVLSGSKNTVDVDALEKATVTGNDNTVTYKQGISGKPKYVATGTSNKFNQVK
jgi:hypothetical protein